MSEEKSKHDELVALSTFGTSAEAILAKGFLHSLGIESWLGTDQLGVGTTELRVRRSDATVARRTMDDLGAQAREESVALDEKDEHQDKPQKHETPSKTRKPLGKLATGLVRIVALLVLFGFGSWLLYGLEFLVVALIVIALVSLVTFPLFKNGSVPFLATCVLPILWLESINGLSGFKAWLIAFDCCLWIALLPFIRGWVPAVRPLFANWTFRQQVVRSIQYAVVAWIAISVVNRISRGNPITLDAARYRTVVESSGLHQSVGLALSGGGYRAAIYHAGVASALEHFALPPTHLSSVSGGSIFAGFYAMGGDPNEFPLLVKQKRFDLLRRVTYADEAIAVLPSFVLRHWPLGSRTQAQARLLNDVFMKNVRIGDLPSGGPKWIICATDLFHGWGVGIFEEGIIIHPLLRASERLPFKNAASESGFDRPILLRETERARSAPVAGMMAASGAFPMAFDALRVNRFGVPLLLSDGGVSDNTGLALLLDAHLLSTAPSARSIPDSELEELAAIFGAARGKPLGGWKLDVVISSDAGLPLRQSDNDALASQIGQALDTVFANGSLPPTSSASIPPSVIMSPADLVNYDFSPTQSELVKLAGNTTEEEATAAFLRMRASGIVRKRRLVEQSLTLAPEAESYIRDRLITDHKDEEPGLDTSRFAQIGMILYKLRPNGMLKLGEHLDQELLDKVVLSYEKYLSSFLATGTLRSEISDEDVDNIFRLGQLTVALNLQALRAAAKVTH
jgi:predicted acylesterase/phospholipase RssA